MAGPYRRQQTATSLGLAHPERLALGDHDGGVVKEALSRGHDYPDVATWDRPEAGLDLGIITDPRC
jgi:hypothetical protein